MKCCWKVEAGLGPGPDPEQGVGPGADTGGGAPGSGLMRRGSSGVGDSKLVVMKSGGLLSAGGLVCSVWYMPGPFSHVGILVAAILATEAVRRPASASSRS